MTRTPRSRLAAVAATILLAACGAQAPSSDASAARPAATPTSSAVARPAGATATDENGGCRDAGAGPGVDASGLRSFVRKRSSQLRDCYQRALKRDASAGGRATISFTIGVCGEVTGVAVGARRGKVDDAAACAVRAVQGWRTPFRPAEPVTVEYPLSFSASM